MSKRKWTISVYNEVKDNRIASKSVRGVCNRMLSLLDLEYLPENVSELAIYFVDGPAIKELNHGYRGKNKITDVLSFPMIQHQELSGGNSGFELSLGDVVICLEQSFRQHKEFGTTKNGEIVRLLIHGILHLLGYDHEGVSEFEAAKMRSLEASLFEIYGRTVVYKAR